VTNGALDDVVYDGELAATFVNEESACGDRDGGEYAARRPR